MTLTVTGLSAIRSGRTILHPTSLVIHPRERIGIVGASGSGKSTLGHALIDDLRQQGHSVAHVPQSPDEALDPLRSMAFHWREAEEALGLQAGHADREGLFRALKIEGGDLRKRPWGWSRGMQQRFVIAMALIGAPDLIALDEPTSALDPVVAAATMELLSGFLDGKDTAMALITHDLGLAALRVDRLLVMADGHLVEEGRTEDILERPETQAAKALSAHRNWMALPC
ncbi:MAG: ATP-binding cassette domain-containing protein [Litoreibacter sp.]|nr:ATP-binding cassette domain-containing protein [Litoreibacter sp.]MCY4334114.1 ATP-binding cassette domain-containing protein [Litoreibacter sp.]